MKKTNHVKSLTSVMNITDIPKTVCVMTTSWLESGFGATGSAAQFAFLRGSLLCCFSTERERERLENNVTIHASTCIR